jgi:hypothetical protein
VVVAGKRDKIGKNDNHKGLSLRGQVIIYAVADLSLMVNKRQRKPSKKNKNEIQPTTWEAR